MNSITHKFVDYIPSTLDDGVVYISRKYKTMAHNCCCGCGNEVITPIGKTDWQLTEEVDTITIYPSIGNWSFKCKSHYWINKNRVLWADQWTDEMIQAGRLNDKLRKQQYYKEKSSEVHFLTRFINSIWNYVRKWWG